MMISDEQYTIKEDDGRWISIFFYGGRIAATYGATEEDAIESSWKIMEGMKHRPFFLVLGSEDSNVIGPVMQQEICRVLDISVEEFRNVLVQGSQNMPNL